MFESAEFDGGVVHPDHPAIAAILSQLAVIRASQDVVEKTVADLVGAIRQSPVARNLLGL